MLPTLRAKFRAELEAKVIAKDRSINFISCFILTEARVPCLYTPLRPSDHPLVNGLWKVEGQLRGPGLMYVCSKVLGKK